MYGLTNLNEGRSSCCCVIGDSILAAGENDVCLTVEAFWNSDGEAAVDWRCDDKGGACDGDEGGVDGHSSTSRFEGIAWGPESDGAVGLDGHGGSLAESQ